MSAPLIPVTLTRNGQSLGVTHMRTDTADEMGIRPHEMIGPALWAAVLEDERKRKARERHG